MSKSTIAPISTSSWAHATTPRTGKETLLSRRRSWRRSRLYLTLRPLDNYDYERLTIDQTTKVASFHATYENAMEQIQRLRDKFWRIYLFEMKMIPKQYWSNIPNFGSRDLYQV